MKDYKTILALAFLVVVFSVLTLINDAPKQQLGASVRVGDQYQSTTTPQVSARRNVCPARSGMASSTTGVLGSVVITKSGTSPLTIYDATTTNITLRGNTATTSLILVDFPSDPGQGTFTFDVEFKRGLLIDYSSTNVSTSTITYRCEG